MESLVLDYWNGRPSVWMSTSVNGDPYLHWMIVGHTEDFEVWMHVRLTWQVADAFATRAPLRLEEALRLVPEAPARLVLSDGGRPIMYTDTVVPAGGGGLTAAVMAPFIDDMAAAMARTDDDQLLLKAATKDVTELVST